MSHPLHMLRFSSQPISHQSSSFFCPCIKDWFIGPCLVCYSATMKMLLCNQKTKKQVTVFCKEKSIDCSKSMTEQSVNFKTSYNLLYPLQTTYLLHNHFLPRILACSINLFFQRPFTLTLYYTNLVYISFIFLSSRQCYLCAPVFANNLQYSYLFMSSSHLQYHPTSINNVLSLYSMSFATLLNY